MSSKILDYNFGDIYLSITNYNVLSFIQSKIY